MPLPYSRIGKHLHWKGFKATFSEASHPIWQKSRIGDTEEGFLLMLKRAFQCLTTDNIYAKMSQFLHPWQMETFSSEPQSHEVLYS
jgi:hypothetical protein